MKAKILLTGIVAPLCFAACTSEEIVPQQEAAKVDLSERPTLGEVALGFENQTRATLDDEGAFNALKWTNTDAIGARIIDRPNGKNKLTHYLNYEGVDYASTNYKYAKGQGDLWSTEALLVEGNYMFYAPYNEKALTREQLKVTFPIEQSIDPTSRVIDGADANTDAIQKFYENEEQVSVLGYTFLDAANPQKVVTPTMTHIYAYPQITLKNAYAPTIDSEVTPTAIEVKQVVISSDKFKKNYTVQHAAFINKMHAAYAAVADPTTGKKDGTGQGNSDVEAGAWNNAVSFFDAKTTDIMVGSGDASITVNFNPALKLEAGGEFSFHVVMPADVYYAGDISYTIVMPGEERDQTFMASGNVKTFENNTKVSYAPGKRYAKEEYNFGNEYAKGYQIKPSAGALGVVTLTAEEIGDYVAPVTDIDNLDDFVSKYLEKLTNNDRPVVEGTTTFKFATYPVGHANAGYSKVHFNRAMMNAIKKYLSGSNATVTFNTPMLIEEDLTGDYAVTSKFIFKEAVKQSGKIVLSTSTGAAVFGGEATLNQGANINGTATFNKATINNATISSNVTFNSGDVTVSTLKGATTIDINKASVTINDNANAPALTTINVKEGTLTVQEENFTTGRSIIVGTLNGSNKADKAGTLYLKKEANFTGITLNNGTIYVESVINGVSKETWNNGTINVASNGELNIPNDVIWNIPANGKLVNKGNISFGNSYSKIWNKGEIENHSIMTIWTNDGNIVTKDGSSTVITHGNGKVNNQALANVTAPATNVVYYTYTSNVTEEDLNKFKTDDYGITKIIFNGNVSLNKIIDATALNGITALEFAGNDAKVHLNIQQALSTKIKDLTFSGTTTISGFSQEKGLGIAASDAKITVAYGKTLTIQNVAFGAVGSTAKIAWDLQKDSEGENEAKVVVNGAYVGVGTAGIVPAFTSKNGGKIETKYFNGSAWI